MIYSSGVPSKSIYVSNQCIQYLANRQIIDHVIDVLFFGLSIYFVEKTTLKSGRPITLILGNIFDVHLPIPSVSMYWQMMLVI